MSLQIVHYNEPILRKKGAPVTTFDAPLQALANDMIDTMHAAHGIGLAAQQIGRDLQLCVVDVRETERDFTWELDGAKPPLDLFMPMVLANPEIKVKRGTEHYIVEEGCLSFPEIRGDVVRPDVISVKFQDQFGVPHVLLCNGMLSRCIQHETDHLHGTLFIDRMEKAVFGRIEKAVRELARQTKADSRT